MEVSDLRGIDISSWQRGMTAASLNSVDFAILKISEGQSWNDPQFDTFYDMATIPLGAYVYSHATTEGEAIAEAVHALALLDGRKLPLGVYIDIEESKQLALHDLTHIVNAFCDAIQQGGYIAGAYGSAGNLWRKVDRSAIGECIVWVASWGARPSYGDVWQDTASLRINGYSGNVDGDKVLSERFGRMVVSVDGPSTEPNGTVCTVTATLPIIKYGDRGMHVKLMQTALIAKGYSCGWMGADGWFGDQSKIALHEWQKKNGIDDKDVVCRSESWTKLLEV